MAKLKHVNLFPVKLMGKETNETQPACEESTAHILALVTNKSHFTRILKHTMYLGSYERTSMYCALWTKFKKYFWKSEVWGFSHLSTLSTGFEFS